MIKYKIAVLTLQGKTLTFTVSDYEITDGDFVEFFDEYTRERKSFHASRCEIKKIEVKSNA